MAFLVNLAPNFSHVSLSDDQPVSEALAHVFKARGRAFGDEFTQPILDVIKTQANTVGDLRKLSDIEWQALKIPVMCRIYLKYCARQSTRPAPVAPPPMDTDPFLSKLQNDFNYGKPFVMETFSKNLDTLKNMGFDFSEALEALLIVENRSAQDALELLLKTPEQRNKKRNEVVMKLGRSVSSGNASNGGGVGGGGGAGEAVLAQQITLLKAEIKQRQKEREEEGRVHSEEISRSVYREFLRGVICDQIVTIQELDALTRLREQRKISAQEHLAVLKDLGLTREAFDKMKETSDANKQKDTDCVVCLERNKVIALVPCGHLCLCEVCQKGISKCPLCNADAASVLKIFA